MVSRRSMLLGAASLVSGCGDKDSVRDRVTVPVIPSGPSVEQVPVVFQGSGIGRGIPQMSDVTPDQFTFVDQSGVALSSTITSAAVTISGLDGATQITINASGGTIDKNASGSFGASLSVQNSDTVRARVTSSASNSTTVSCVVTAIVSGVTDTFGATTLSGAGFSGPHIGGNISGGGDSVDSPWVNLVDNSRGFGVQGTNYEGGELTTDSNGWPTQAWENIISVNNNKTNSIQGVYSGSYDDAGTCTISAYVTQDCSLSNIVRVGTHVTFDITVTAPTFVLGLHGSAGCTNLKIITPGYTASDTLITPAINYFKKFSCLRGMDFMVTNQNTYHTTWASRTIPEKRHGADSWESLFDFITVIYNASGSNLRAVWICVPIAADASYLAGLAALCASRLPSGIVIYVELSNEIWNSQFSQYGWLLNWANNPVNPDYARVGGASIASPSYYAMKYQWALSYARLATAFRSVLGSRARPVLAGQWVDRAWTADALAFLDSPVQVAEFGVPSYYTYALSAAPYLQTFTSGETAPTSSAMCGHFQYIIDNYMTANNAAWIALRDQYGIPVVNCYEIGTDYQNDVNIAVKVASWNDSVSVPVNMTQVTYNVVKKMWDAGFEVVCHYNIDPNALNTSLPIWYSMWTTNQSFSDTTARGTAMNQLIAEHP